jgi:hypothetical protein
MAAWWVGTELNCHSTEAGRLQRLGFASTQPTHDGCGTMPIGFRVPRFPAGAPGPCPPGPCPVSLSKWRSAEVTIPTRCRAHRFSKRARRHRRLTLRLVIAAGFNPRAPASDTSALSRRAWRRLDAFNCLLARAREDRAPSSAAGAETACPFWPKGSVRVAGFGPAASRVQGGRSCGLSYTLCGLATLGRIELPRPRRQHGVLPLNERVMVRTGELESPNTTFSRWRLCRFAYVRILSLVNQPGFEPGVGIRLPIKSRVPSAAWRHWS